MASTREMLSQCPFPLQPTLRLPESSWTVPDVPSSAPTTSAWAGPATVTGDCLEGASYPTSGRHWASLPVSSCSAPLPPSAAPTLLFPPQPGASRLLSLALPRASVQVSSSEPLWSPCAPPGNLPTSMPTVPRLHKQPGPPWILEPSLQVPLAAPGVGEGRLSVRGALSEPDPQPEPASPDCLPALPAPPPAARQGT